MPDPKPDPDTLHETGRNDATRKRRQQGTTRPRTGAEPEEVTCASPPCLLGELDGSYGTH